MDITELKKKATPVLEHYGVQSASVFGSVARGEARENSDVDILVRVHTIPHGIWGLVGLKQDLEHALGKKVDVVSDEGVMPTFASAIDKDLVTIYEG